MKKRSGLYPRVRVDARGRGVVSQAGGLLLTDAIRVSGLDGALSGAVARWRKPLARHDPAKIVLDLAVALALGGDCLADVAVLRGAPEVFGPIASDPTVSRTIDALATDVVRVLAGGHAPDADTRADDPLIIDADATLLTSHSDKEGAAPTFKRGYGFHPLWAFVDHGSDGTGEPLAVMLRPGNAGSNTAAEATLDLPIEQTPPRSRQHDDVWREAERARRRLPRPPQRDDTGGGARWLQDG